MLEQEQIETASRRTNVIVAPQVGIVTAVGVSNGQWVNAGQTLAALHPRGVPLEANLYATSRVSGFVAPDQPVFIRYAAYPYQKFGLQSGKVAEVSESAFAPTDLPLAVQNQFARQGSEALYKIRVALDAQSIDTYGDSKPLKAGMALEGDIVQDRRTVLEWIFEPLIAIGKRT